MEKFSKFLAKPSRLQLVVSVFFIAFFAFYVKEGVCAISSSLLFAYCVNEHGFPFTSIIRGDISSIPKEMLTDKPLGGFFFQKGKTLINPAGILLNALVYYTFIALLFFLGNLKK